MLANEAISAMMNQHCIKKLECDYESTFVMLQNNRRERTKLLLLPVKRMFLAFRLTLRNK